MNNIAHLQFGDNESGLYNKDFLVVEARIHLGRTDNAYHPDSQPSCSEIEISVVTPGKRENFLSEWFYRDTNQSGRIVFELSEISSGSDEVKNRIFEFSDAKCFGYAEKFDIGEGRLRLSILKFRAATFEVDGMSFLCP